MVSGEIPLAPRHDKRRLRDMLFSRAFVQLYLMNFLSISFGYFIIGQYKKFGLNYMDDTFLSVTGSVASLLSGLRFVFAFLMDRFSFKLVFAAVLALQTVVAATIYHVVSYKYLYLIWVSTAFLCEAGHFSVLPTICGQTFGKNAP